MNFSDYQKLCARTAGTHLSKDIGVMVSALGLTGESGEVADYLKKIYGHGHELDLAKLKKELGDVMWYVSDICTKFGISLNEVASLNIEKLKTRYPEGFSTEKSTNRKSNDT